MNALSALAPFARRWQAVPRAGERCELCGAELPAAAHPHLVELERRRLLCACAACADSAPGSLGDRYRRVPTRVLVDPAFSLTDMQWSALQIPVRLAFLFFNSRLERWVALYPGPAGPAESQLTLEAFSTIAAATPLARAAAPDVEALLVNGDRGSRFETFLVPIDLCYELVGRIRLRWRGFHGGDEAWREIAAFFADLRARARGVA
jgi:hypothetical protein